MSFTTGGVFYPHPLSFLLERVVSGHRCAWSFSRTGSPFIPDSTSRIRTSRTPLAFYFSQPCRMGLLLSLCLNAPSYRHYWFPIPLYSFRLPASMSGPSQVHAPSRCQVSFQLCRVCASFTPFWVLPYIRWVPELAARFFPFLLMPAPHS